MAAANCSLAVSTSLANPSGSRAAMSARIFRSSSMPASFSPWIKLAVRQPGGAAGCADADNPQAAELALALAAMPVCVRPGVHHRLFGPLVIAVGCALEAPGLFEDLLVPSALGHPALYSYHNLFSIPIIPSHSGKEPQQLPLFRRGRNSNNSLPVRGRVKVRGRKKQRL